MPPCDYIYASVFKSIKSTLLLAGGSLISIVFAQRLLADIVQGVGDRDYRDKSIA